MGQIGVTKFIEPIKTKISLNGGYQWKRQTTLQNDNEQKYTWKSWTFSPYLTSQPCKYVELAYNGMFAKTYLSTKYQNNRGWKRIQFGTFPVKKFRLSDN